MRDVRLNVGIAIDDYSSLYYVTSKDFNDFDLGCGIFFEDGSYFEIEDLDVDSGIAGLRPLNESAIIFSQKSQNIFITGFIRQFEVRDVNISRRLIEDGETYSEFEARKFDNKLNERTKKFIEDPYNKLGLGFWCRNYLITYNGIPFSITCFGK